MIRAAARSDVESVLDLWEALNRDGSAADARYAVRPDARDAMKRTWVDVWMCQDPFPGCLVAGADDGALLGFITGTLARENPILEPVAQVHIDNLYVRPQFRRAGLGRELVTAFIGRAGDGRSVSFDVGTLVRDRRAVAFWEALGFDVMRVTLVRQ